MVAEVLEKERKWLALGSGGCRGQRTLIVKQEKESVKGKQDAAIQEEQKESLTRMPREQRLREERHRQGEMLQTG